MTNICMCGTQAGYPHPATCPYPLYRGSDDQIDQWLEAAGDLVDVQQVIAFIERRAAIHSLTPRVCERANADDAVQTVKEATNE